MNYHPILQQLINTELTRSALLALGSYCHALENNFHDANIVTEFPRTFTNYCTSIELRHTDVLSRELCSILVTNGETPSSNLKYLKNKHYEIFKFSIDLKLVTKVINELHSLVVAKERRIFTENQRVNNPIFGVLIRDRKSHTSNYSMEELDKRISEKTKDLRECQDSLIHWYERVIAKHTEVEEV